MSRLAVPGDRLCSQTPIQADRIEQKFK